MKTICYNQKFTTYMYQIYDIISNMPVSNING